MRVFESRYTDHATHYNSRDKDCKSTLSLSQALEHKVLRTSYKLAAITINYYIDDDAVAALSSLRARAGINELRTSIGRFSYKQSTIADSVYQHVYLFYFTHLSFTIASTPLLTWQGCPTNHHKENTGPFFFPASPCSGIYFMFFFCYVNVRYRL